MNSDSDLQDVQAYRDLVLRYEALEQQIDALFAVHRGGTDKMSEEELRRYRALQQQRDELLSEMRVWEQRLSIDDAN